MLIVSYIRDMLCGRSEQPPRRLTWSGATLNDLAPDGASMVFVGRERVEPEKWAESIPPDGSQVTFVQVPAGDSWWSTGPLYWIFGDSVGFLYPWTLKPDFPGAPEAEGVARGFGNAQNTTAEGSVIPVIYGENLTGGIILQRWTSEGPKQDEIFHGLYLISHGPVQSLAGLTSDTTEPVASTSLAPGELYIGDIDATELSECQVQTRLGADPQSAMTGFENVVLQYAANVECTHEDFFTWATRDAVNAVELNVSFPEGWYYIAQSDGKPSRRKQHINMGVWAEGDDPDTDAPVASTSFYISDKRTKPFTRSFRIGGLQTARYIVRFWYPAIPTHVKIPSRFFGKTLVIAMKEILFPRGGGIAYNNMALLAIDVRATDQLSGGIPKISLRCKGRKVYDTRITTTVWSQNPAMCVRDFLLNTTYGLGDSIVAGGVDTSSFEDWADACDASIPQWTGAGSNEARYKMNAVLNEGSDAWPLVQGLASEHGAFLVNLGTSVIARLAEQLSPVFAFTSANMRANETGRPELTIAVDNPSTRYDAITVRFRDEEKDFETSAITVPLGIIETEATRIRSVELQSITSPTQANRFAHRLFRQEKSILETWSWEAGIDAIPIEVGDNVLVGRELPECWHGRISDYSAGTSITLDQSIEFEANTLYTYIEQDNTDNTISERDFQMPAGAASVLPFGPLTSGDAVYRKWIIGKRIEVKEPVLIRKILASDGGFRRIEGVNYVDDIYTDDAESMDPSHYSPPLGAAPSAASNLAVVETWLADGISTLTVTWNGGAGSSRYAVWIRSLADEGLAWSHCGVVLHASDPHTLAFQTNEAPGTPVEIAVQSIGANGQETVIGATSITYTIARDDENDTVSVYPDDVENLTLTLVSGNQYTLTWDAVSPVTNYEVRHGNTQGGLLLGEPGSESFTLNLNRAANYVDVRAVLNGKYSQRVARIIAGPPTHTGAYSTFTTLEAYIEMEPIAGADVRIGTAVGVGYVRNASRQVWLNDDNALLQTVKIDDQPLTYISQGADLGSSKTVHISPAVRALSWFDDPLEIHALSEGDWSWAGAIGAQYMDWRYEIQYGDTAAYEKSFVIGEVSGGNTVTENLNANHTLTGRHFRMFFSGFPRRMDDTNQLECRVLLEKLALHLYS